MSKIQTVFGFLDKSKTIYAYCIYCSCQSLCHIVPSCLLRVYSTSLNHTLLFHYDPPLLVHGFKVHKSILRQQKRRRALRLLVTVYRWLDYSKDFRRSKTRSIQFSLILILHESRSYRNAPLQTCITCPFTCLPISEARNRHAFA